MKMTTERLAELEGPISAYEQSESVEKRCIASAFRALLVDLEEATEDIEHWKDLAKGRKDVIEELRAELAATRKQLVYEFNGDDVPSFRDGVLIPHELEDMVDAERCRSLANIITGLRKQPEAHERNAGEPTELEMHRADYEACKAAGFQSPGELLSAYKTQSKQLAEAQARLEQVMHTAEKMRCSGGAQEFGYWYDELKLFLLRKRDTAALDAILAQRERETIKRCAKVCDVQAGEPECPERAEYCAAAIRAMQREEKEQP